MSEISNKHGNPIPDPSSEEMAKRKKVKEVAEAIRLASEADRFSLAKSKSVTDEIMSTMTEEEGRKYKDDAERARLALVEGFDRYFLENGKRHTMDSRR